jgi:hypothetical protein
MVHQFPSSDKIILLSKYIEHNRNILTNTIGKIKILSNIP